MSKMMWFAIAANVVIWGSVFFLGGWNASDAARSSTTPLDCTLAALMVRDGMTRSGLSERRGAGAGRSVPNDMPRSWSAILILII
jgi:hypothetical protein